MKENRKSRNIHTYIPNVYIIYTYISTDTHTHTRTHTHTQSQRIDAFELCAGEDS